MSFGALVGADWFPCQRKGSDIAQGTRLQREPRCGRGASGMTATVTSHDDTHLTLGCGPCPVRGPLARLHDGPPSISTGFPLAG